MIWIICIVVYLLSCLISWYYVHVAFSEKGIYKNIDVEGDSLFMVIFPVINTSFAITSWVFYWPIKKEKSYNKFFKIKK